MTNFSLAYRELITPDGRGMLIGVDNKDDPQVAVVLVRIEGWKLRQARTYQIEELQEVEK